MPVEPVPTEVILAFFRRNGYYVNHMGDHITVSLHGDFVVSFSRFGSRYHWSVNPTGVMVTQKLLKKWI